MLTIAVKKEILAADYLSYLTVICESDGHFETGMPFALILTYLSGGETAFEGQWVREDREMPIGDSVLFGMLNQKMDYLAQRQRVLAQNVANADTPGYAARDLKPLDFRQAVALQGAVVKVATTDPQHLSVPVDDGSYESRKAPRVYETSVSENSVIVEEQMMKLAATAGDFSLATSVYRKYTQMHRAALGSGR